MEKKFGIIGAGISGLLACKYTLEIGLNPVVFEAAERLGGVWGHTIESTKLQNVKETYQFSDFRWPNSVKEAHPTHTQMMEYLESYARRFNLYQCIKFNSKVIDIDYVGESYEEMKSWDFWGGNGRAFGSKGKWHIRVQHTKNGTLEVYEADFVILCMGQFSGFPNIPEFGENQGPEIFHGKLMHSMEYSAMERLRSKELIRGKRVTIIGSHKSAVDIAAECANINGPDLPCTMIRRSCHWFLPSNYTTVFGISLRFLYGNRFSELTTHKPGETFLQCMFAILLSPLRWVISKFVECYIKWNVPLKKHGMVPQHSFFEDISSCQIGMLPENFYDKVEEGSIVLKKAQSFAFCNQGLILDGGANPLETDVVILATGYKGDLKLKNIFASQIFQELMMGSPDFIVPLHRQIINPRIPGLAVIGYSESFSNLGSSEMKCQWLAHFLAGNFKLPSIRDMEKEIRVWGDYIKKLAGRHYRRSCISNVYIWYCDQLCKDIGCRSRRKKGFLAELFEPYGPTDYAALSSVSTKSKTS
ncbi:hypothetical protein SLE2022_127230 [Rubroshorea leprosula]